MTISFALDSFGRVFGETPWPVQPNLFGTMVYSSNGYGYVEARVYLPSHRKEPFKLGLSTKISYTLAGG